MACGSVVPRYQTATNQKKKSTKQGKSSPHRILLLSSISQAVRTLTAPFAIIYSTKAFPLVTQCTNRKRKRSIPTPSKNHMSSACGGNTGFFLLPASSSLTFGPDIKARAHFAFISASLCPISTFTSSGLHNISYILCSLYLLSAIPFSPFLLCQSSGTSGAPRWGRYILYHTHTHTHYSFSLAICASRYPLQTLNSLLLFHPFSVWASHPPLLSPFPTSVYSLW